MTTTFALFACSVLLVPNTQDPAAGAAALPKPVQSGAGLHGYIGYEASPPADRREFGMGMGFYSAAWSLIDRPLAHFQIGLTSGWTVPDNRDNKDQPLAPEGTLARTGKERGPTWDSASATARPSSA